MQLEQSSKWYNPFFIDGYEVKDIIFYNESGKICHTNQGWFGSNNGMGCMEIGDCVRKLKIKTDFRKNFFIPVPQDSYKDGKAAEVWLYVDGQNIKCERLPDTQTSMLDDTMILHYENYAVSVYGVEKRIEQCAGSERTKFGREVDKLADTFKEMGIRIDHYETIKLLQSFNVRRKK